MKTRRRSTRKTTGGKAEDESSPPAHSPTPSAISPSTIPTFHLPDDIQLDSLSSLIPDVSFDAPTPEALIQIYRILLAQASDIINATSDLEEARAQILRKDIELDQAAQDKETAVSELEQSLETARNELKSVVHQRDEIVVSQAALQSQMVSLSVAQSSRSSELDILQHRVDDAEREKRDLITVVDRLRTDSTQAEEQIQVLKDSLKKSRDEIIQLQTEVREVRSTETTNKFKIQSLEQQLEISKHEGERNAKELDAKIEEFAKYRRDTHAQQASLQSSLDSLRLQYESCKSDVENLKRSYENERQRHLASIDKANTLQDQLAEERGASKVQSETQTRLIELLEKRTAEAKKRVEEVDNEWDRTVREHEEKVERLNELLRKEKERADRLETNLARLVEGTSVSAPEPSPGASVVASFMKGIKLSDLFDENRRAKEELQRVKTENLRLTETTSALISRMHEMAPQIAERRVEYERQKQEIVQLSQQLSTVISERDANLHLARETQSNLQSSQKENKLLERQLSDLGRQVQVLLREITILQNPSLSTVDQVDELPDSASQGIDALISNQLVVFKHLPAFQDQYVRHLKIIRELGDKLERVTKEQYEEQARLETQALEEAEVAIAALQEELENQRRAFDIQIRGFIQERDMYKARLANTFRKSPAAESRTAETGDPEYDALLGDMQRNFDIYRNETGIDMQKLREEIQESQKEIARLETELAKATAKVENYNNRYAVLTDSFNQQREELTTLRRRHEELLNHSTRLESASYQVSEQLATANSTVDRLRYETAAIKAEKDLWKNIERRLTEENQSLSKEKSQLSDLMSNISRMHIELEHSIHNDKRRLESHIQVLEAQSQESKLQLNKEREALRHVTLKKDLDTKELQGKIDRMTEDLSKTRESYIAAQTSQTHLQQRVDDLSKQLQAGNEKLAVYERRTSTFPAQPGQDVEMPSREEQLESEVADLRGSIKLMEMDLESSRSQIEQISNISRASETALEKVSEAFEDYKKSTDATLVDRDSALEHLRDQLRTVESELTVSNTKFNELNQQLEAERAAFLSDKKALEETIIDISNNAVHLQTDEAERAKTIQSYEERAVASDQRYQRELIAHADAVKQNEQLKEQFAKLKVQIREHENAAETARSMLSTAEASWQTQRLALDKELSDLTTRCQGLQTQNSLLHQHLESVNSQASRIRQVAEQSTGEGAETEGDGSDLRPVVAYLRNEKEIVDLQLELHKQENMRLKTQIEHLTRSLDESRMNLTEERERASNPVVSASQHAELLERINQLNLLRESNATLRSESESHRKQSESLEAKLRKLSAELSPVKEEVTTLRAELSSKSALVQRLEAENLQWKERNYEILSKFDRVDPAEMQQLKDKVATLEAEKTSWDTTKSTMEADLANIEQYKTNLQDYKKRYGELMTKLRSALTENKELVTARDATKANFETQVQSLESEREILKGQVDTLNQEKIALEKSLIDGKARSEKAVAGETASLSGSQEQEAAIKAAVDSAKSAWEEEKTQLTKARDEIAEREKAASMQLQALTTQKAQIDTLTGKLRQRLSEEIRKQRDQQASQEQMVAAKIAEATAQLTREHEAALQSAVANATAKAKPELQDAASLNMDAVTSTQSHPDIEHIRQQHRRELAALETRLTEKYEAEMKAQKEVAAAAAIDNGGAPEAVESIVKQRMETFQKEHEQKLTDAVERGRREVNVKLKLKDSQLAKSLAGRKELEDQIVALKDQLTAAGIVPSIRVATPGTVPVTPAKPSGTLGTPTSTPVVPSAPPSTPVVPYAPPSTPVVSAAPTAPAAAVAPSGPPHLPPRPVTTVVPVSKASGTGQTSTAVRGAAARGRGRGVSIRGGAAAASHGVGRGGSVLAQVNSGGAAAASQGAGRGGNVLAQVNSAAAASPSGTSILGAAAAAAKRPREESETSSTDPQSLAKRLRGTPPVTLQRNRHLPSTDTPQ